MPERMVVYNIIHAFTYIYALCDPETDLVYYVGQATNPKFRHRTHILEAQSPDGVSNKCVWIKGLLDRGMEPSLKVLLKVNKEFAIDYEKRMITYYKSTNINLCNMMFAGEKGKMIPQTKVTPQVQRRRERKRWWKAHCD